ncbi:hypothetical protein GCM10010266_06790 [Streptomyces griseomycini]|nr:hypothetical protein GCM10010266_06790 [Streptomyces griseomycini]
MPRPSDWRSGLEGVGNWWPRHGAAERLPTDLEDFLGAGPRPVLIGFGSMAAGDGERLSEIAVRALRRAGLRGVLQAGSAGLAADGDDVLTVGDVPHALLFPRLAAVVHHAGAGTSAAALRAGVPAVTVPVTADQPFWAGRLAALGAATGPIPFRSLTAERLADSLGQVVRRGGVHPSRRGSGAPHEERGRSGPGAQGRPAADRGVTSGRARDRCRRHDVPPAAGAGPTGCAARGAGRAASHAGRGGPGPGSAPGGRER